MGSQKPVKKAWAQAQELWRRPQWGKFTSLRLIHIVCGDGKNENQPRLGQKKNHRQPGHWHSLQALAPHHRASSRSQGGLSVGRLQIFREGPPEASEIPLPSLPHPGPLASHSHPPLPVDGTHTGYRVIVTHSLCQQPVPDLPGKHGGILAFIFSDFFHHFGRGNLWFGSSDYPRLDASSLIIPRTQGQRELSHGKTGKYLRQGERCECKRYNRFLKTLGPKRKV